MNNIFSGSFATIVSFVNGYLIILTPVYMWWQIKLNIIKYFSELHGKPLLKNKKGSVAERVWQPLA